MAGKNESSKGTRSERYTWKKGDVVVTDRNGNPIDFNKLNKASKAAAKAPATKKK